ncbi:hypothetical protein R3I93_010431 [Phoxinus phoxinus]|uniref:Myb/SANT-like DNA-binding domain-containing protein n=1 Tax=Phoxinus phoxinus TaxID=58324 RepID=A0AAN9H7G0_9TELE
MYEEMSVERNWTDTETRALLYIRQDEEISRQISGTVRDSLIYAEISRLLRAQGIHRTKRQVTTKLKTLKQKFLKIHEHHKNTGHGRVYWNYYDLCKSIWGCNRPTNTLTLHNNVKLEEPQSTSIEDARNESRSTSTDIDVSVSHDAETEDMMTGELLRPHPLHALCIPPSHAQIISRLLHRHYSRTIEATLLHLSPRTTSRQNNATCAI